jgi:hypothetical protein
MNLRALIAPDNEGCLTDGKYLPVNLNRTPGSLCRSDDADAGPAGFPDPLYM